MIRIIVGSRGSVIPNGPSSTGRGLRAGTALCLAAPSPKLCLSRLMSSPFCGFIMMSVILVRLSLGRRLERLAVTPSAGLVGQHRRLGVGRPICRLVQRAPAPAVELALIWCWLDSYILRPVGVPCNSLRFPLKSCRLSRRLHRCRGVFVPPPG